MLSRLESNSPLDSGTYDAFHTPHTGWASERDSAMNVRIKATLAFTITGPALEDSLAEFDELSVTGMLQEILDKAIACDNIEVKVVEGPNTLEEYDSQS